MCGNTYFDTGHTTDEWDKMELRIKELEEQLQNLFNHIQSNGTKKS